MLELDDVCSDDSGLSPGGNSLLNPSELSYDVKVSLVRICSMIEQLPFSDESYDLLKRINFEIKRNLELYVPKNPNESTQSTLNPQGNISVQPAFQIGHDPSRIARDRLVSGSERSRKLNSTHNTYSSFKRHDISRAVNNSFLHSSNFQANGTNDPETSIFNYRPISNLNVSTIDESVAEDDAMSDISTVTENSDSFFLMRNWSLQKDANNLYLTGIKLDRKGNLLERDFISKKIISRTPELLVKTDCGNYRLDDPLVDPKNCIPEEIKNLFLKDKSYFPKFWRKALALWNEIEQNELKTQKSRKKNENQKKEHESRKIKKTSPSLEVKNNCNRGLRKSLENESGKSKKNSSHEVKNSVAKGRKKTQENEPGKLKKNSPLEDKPNGTKGQKKTPENELGKLKKNSPLLEIETSGLKGQKKTQKKEESSKQQKKNDSTKSLKQQEKNKKKEDKPPKKKAKSDDKPSKTGSKKNVIPEEEEEEEEGSESELVDFGDDSMFQIPSTSLTPTGLLASITKTTIKGRYTPPTNVFDNIYGKSTTPCSNSSTLDDSFDGAPKDQNVVKRMAKAKSAPSGAKPSQKPVPDSKVSQKPALPQLNDERNNLIDRVLDAVNTQTSQTPEIIKKVFRNKDLEEEEEHSFDDDERDM